METIGDSQNSKNTTDSCPMTEDSGITNGTPSETEEMNGTGESPDENANVHKREKIKEKKVGPLYIWLCYDTFVIKNNLSAYRLISFIRIFLIIYLIFVTQRLSTSQKGNKSVKRRRIRMESDSDSGIHFYYID